MRRPVTVWEAPYRTKLRKFLLAPIPILGSEKDPGTVSRWLTMADRRSLEDADYRAHLDELDTKIAEHARPKVIK